MYDRSKDPMLAQDYTSSYDFWERKKQEAAQEKYINELRAEIESLCEQLSNMAKERDIDNWKWDCAYRELQEQLTECQKECEEQARLNGMGSDREAKLMAQLEAVTNERDVLDFGFKEMGETAKNYLAERTKARQELADLKAKIDEREPVAPDAQETISNLHRYGKHQLADLIEQQAARIAELEQIYKTFKGHVYIKNEEWRELNDQLRRFTHPENLDEVAVEIANAHDDEGVPYLDIAETDAKQFARRLLARLVGND